MIKRLIIIHPHFTIYTGATMFVLELAKHLSKMGVDIKIITITTRAAIVAPYKQYMQFIEIGGPVSSSLSFWIQLPLSTYRIHKLLNKLPHDSVFTQVFPANWWGGLLKLFNPSLKLVWMCQEPSAFIHSNEWIASVKGTGMKIGIRILRPLLRALDIYFTKKHDFVIANSKFTLRNAQSTYKISPENSAYSHLGVDTEIFKPHHQTKLNQFLVVNTLTKFKNTFCIIAAFNSFRKTSASGYKLYIVGAGPTLHGLKKYIERERLGKIVEFLGVGPQKVFIKTFQESKALILASQEPFGLVVAEALASGTPAIVVKGSGASEIIEDGKTGYTFEYMNQKDLLGKMHAIKNATDLETEKMRTACMERAKEFAWPKVAKKYLELLNEAAN